MDDRNYDYRERIIGEIKDFCYENYEQGLINVIATNFYSAKPCFLSDNNKSHFSGLKSYNKYTLVDAIEKELPEINSKNFKYEIKQVVNNLKRMIAGSINNRDALFKSSEICKILSGLQLLGIKCNEISVKEMERCLDEVKKSAEMVKSVNPYDFPFYKDVLNSNSGIYFINKKNCLEAYIDEYQKFAWERVFGVFSYEMLMEEDYSKLSELAENIFYKMWDIEDRKGSIETINEINQMLMELKEEALKIEERINNGEKSLRRQFRACERAFDLPDEELPSFLAQAYLYECFHAENGVYTVDSFHENIANGKYDLILDWDERKAYEITDGNEDYLSREYLERTHIPNTGKTFITARINGFHEYMINRIILLISKLTELDDIKEFDSLDNPYNDLLKYTVDYINLYFIKTFNEENENAHNIKSDELQLIRK